MSRKRDDILDKIVLAQKMRKQNMSLQSNKDNRIISENPVKRVVRSKKTRNRPAKQHPCSSSSTIFISGGIGDVLAVESFLTDEERAKISSVYYATIKQPSVEALLCSLPNWPNLKDHVTVWNDFSNFWCFYSLEDCLDKLKIFKKEVPLSLKRARDLSILKIFEDIKAKKLSYNGSSFVNNHLADISHFSLDQDYIVVAPFSSDKRIRNRDFDHLDWKKCLLCLKEYKMKGVVINSGPDSVPEDDHLINLSNKTSLMEAVEILKKAKGYLGIDSWLSVLAPKLFDYPFLQIKSRNEHCYSNAYCYYAPKTDFSFIRKRIVLPNELRKA